MTLKGSHMDLCDSKDADSRGSFLRNTSYRYHEGVVKARFV